MTPRPTAPTAPAPAYAPHPPNAAPPWLEVALGALAAALVGLGWWVAPVRAELVVDGRASAVTTRAGTVGALLAERGVALGPGDLVMPGAAARLKRGARVEVRRAIAARVHADGRVVRAPSLGRTARAVLVDAGVALGPRDRVSVNGRPHGLDAPLGNLDDPRPAAPSRPSRGLGHGADLASEGIRIADARLDATVPRSARPVADPATVPQVAQAAPAEPRPSGPLPEGLVDALDAVVPDETAALDPRFGTDDALVVSVWRARPVLVEEEGVAVPVELAGATVGEALAAAGIAVWPEDRLDPPLDAPLSGVVRIRVRRATAFVVQADGATRDARAWAATVGEGLERAGAGLVGRDYSVPPADAPLTPGLVVQVVRVREDVQVLETAIPFATETQPDPEMALDQTRLIRAGEPGLKRQRIRITYEDGREIGREVEEESVLREPVAEQVAYGTQIQWGTVDTPEGPKRYWRKLRVYATSYSAARAGTPKSAPWYGRTRLGLVMRRGIVAVDPRVIPLGTNLYVPDYGVGLAGDTGGGIRNYHIDLGYDDDNYQSWHWPVDLYLLEPLPPDGAMRWILP